jgi:orotidine-5'-phosphate decarboxylase
MLKSKLLQFIQAQQSYLCIGLDSDINKLPTHLPATPQSILQFNQNIIQATAQYCISYKINTAFYETLGSQGWAIMEQTVSYIKQNHPQHLIILDAKRGDIGNTATQYAEAFFNQIGADALTISPLMGTDTVEPYLKHTQKWTIVLGLTSNPGSAHFLQTPTHNQIPFYQHIMQQLQAIASPSQLMFVVGATHPQLLATIRQQFPSYIFLVPGVGTQGGTVSQVSQASYTHQAPVIINVSRDIIFASPNPNYAQAAAHKAQAYQTQMQHFLATL